MIKKWLPARRHRPQPLWRPARPRSAAHSPGHPERAESLRRRPQTLKRRPAGVNRHLRIVISILKVFITRASIVQPPPSIRHPVLLLTPSVPAGG